MFKHFISLQWKSFWRSASWSSGIWMQIFMGFWAVYFIVMMLAGSFGAYMYIKEKLCLNPLDVVNRFLIYWFVFDLIFRYALQKMPVINIKPLLILPFNKNKIVSYALGKTVLSFFNVIHGFFFLPFSVLLVVNGDVSIIDALLWNIGLIALIYGNNFFNVLVNKKGNLIYIIAGIVIILASLHYFGYFDITQYTFPFFQGLYKTNFLFIAPILIMCGLFAVVFRSLSKDLYLDSGLAIKSKGAKTENLEWLDRFGKTAVFLKNDIKLIKRNKRARSTVVVSVLFLFYGLLFFTGSFEVYEEPVWKIFAGIFVSGGFLMSFGQFVPSWDSSYYPLMMSQNIRYREYLSSKWWLMVIVTLCSAILASGYLYFGWDAYLAVLVGAIYNMGVNSHIVLWAGAYVKTPIDLTSNKKAFGDKQAFNVKTLMLSLPKLVLPMILYGIGHYTHSPQVGYLLVGMTGIAGFAFRNRVFDKIERIYRTEKYKTIWAYKQKK